MNAKTRLKKESKKRTVTLINGDGNPFKAQKINRNELCPCKSGKKVKNCCKFETRYYTTKPKPKLEEAI
jgi:uncharacterized protein YecA (UPF0149 family)